MDAVAEKFLIGALVPGAAATVMFGLTWLGTPRRGTPQPPTGGINPEQILPDDAVSRFDWRSLVPPVVLTGALAFAMIAITGGFSLAPTDSFGRLTFVVLAAGLSGVLAAASPGPVPRGLVAAVLTAGTAALAGSMLKLGALESALLAVASLVVLAGLSLSLHGRGVLSPLFVWALGVSASQALLLGFGSLRLGLLLHCIAAAAGGAIVISLLWPRLKLGIGAAVVLAGILPAIFLQALRFGGEDTPLWVRITAMSLLGLTPLVFGLARKAIRAKSELLAGTLALVVGGIPAATALGLCVWAWLQISGDV
jgi:hypothetical protein